MQIRTSKFLKAGQDAYLFLQLDDGCFDRLQSALQLEVHFPNAGQLQTYTHTNYTPLRAA